MQRRQFTSSVFLLAGGLIVRHSLFGRQAEQIIRKLAGPGGHDPIIYILNSEVIDSMSREQQQQINKYFAINTFSSDLVPYDRGVKLDVNFMEKFIEHKVQSTILSYEQNNIQIDNAVDETNNRIIMAGMVAGSLSLISAPLLAPALALTGIGLLGAERLTNSYEEKFAVNYSEAILKSELEWRINNNHLDLVSNLPVELRNQFVTNKEQALDRLRSPDPLGDLPGAKKSILSLSSNPNANDPANEQAAKDKEDILVSVFNRMGNMTDMLGSQESETEVADQPPPGEREQQQALFNNFHRLGNVLINQYAGVEEQKYLSVAFNTGMNYLAMAAVSTIHPVGWASLGVGLASNLLEAFGKKKSGGMEAAFKAIFKQLAQIQKSLQRVEQRQIYMISRLNELYDQMDRANRKLDKITEELQGFRNEVQYFFEGELRRTRGIIIADHITKPLSAIKEKAELVYSKKGLARKFYLRQSATIKGTLRNIYDFILIDSQLEEFNGTGNLTDENSALYNPSNGGTVKRKIFNTVYEDFSNRGGLKTSQLIYDQVGLLPYLYQAAYPNAANLEFRVLNPRHVNDGVVALVDSFFMLHQKELFALNERKIWIRNLLTTIKTQIQHLNRFASKTAVSKMSENYVKEGVSIVFTNSNSLHRLATAASREELFDIDVAVKPELQEQVKQFRKKLQLKSTGSSLGDFKRSFPVYSMPFTDPVAWNKAPGQDTHPFEKAGYEILHNKKLIRDYPFKLHSGTTLVSAAEKVYERPATFDVLTMLKYFGFAKVSDVKNASNWSKHDKSIVSTQIRIGHAVESTLKKITFADNLPYVGGLSILFTDSRMIAGFKPVYKTEDYGHDGNLTRYILIFLKPYWFYHEYSFSPITPFFREEAGRHWQLQLRDQLTKLNRTEDFELIPGLTDMSIIDFLEFVLNKGIDTKIKTEKIEQLINDFAANNEFDHAAASLFLTSRLNQTIATKGAISFSTNYNGQIFRSEDVQVQLNSLRYFDQHNKSGQALIGRLKEIERKEDGEANQPDFKIETSVFYYKELQRDGTYKTSKLSLEDFYQFLIIVIRLSITDTYHQVGQSVTDLSEDDAEPLLAHAAFVLNSYKKAMLPG